MSASKLSELHLTAGTYYSIASVATLTALQVCSSDEWSTTNRGGVRAFPMTNCEDQHWTFIPHVDDTFAIQSLVQSEDNLHLYLCPSESRSKYGSLTLAVGPVPFGWKIQFENKVLRIILRSTNEVFDISYRRKHPNTPVQLLGRKDGEACQYWSCIPRSPLPTQPQCTPESESVNKRLAAAPTTQKARLDIQSSPPWTLSTKPYILESAHSRNKALDLPLSTKLPLYICHDLHGHLHQQWSFIRSGDGYAIKSMWAPALDPRPLYLTVEEPSALGTDTLSILWPGSQLVMALVKDQIKLAQYDPYAAEMVWHYVCA